MKKICIICEICGTKNSDEKNPDEKNPDEKTEKLCIFQIIILTLREKRQKSFNYGRKKLK